MRALNKLDDNRFNSASPTGRAALSLGAVDLIVSTKGLAVKE